MELFRFLRLAVVFLTTGYLVTVEAVCVTNGTAIINACETQYNFTVHNVLTLFGGLRTSQLVEHYCSISEDIIACLDPLTEGCIAGQSVLDIQGYDKDSVTKTFRGFCNDKATYITGITCYDTNNASLVSCQNEYLTTLASAMANLTTSSDYDRFYTELCPARVTGVECAQNALSTCSAAVKAVIKNVAFAILHSQCKNTKYTSITSDYDSAALLAQPISVVLLLAALLAAVLWG